MTRFLFSASFSLGAIAIAWMSMSFSGTNHLALAVTALIGLAFIIGAIELFQFRQQTASLNKALANITAEVGSLDNWLSNIDRNLVNPVRTRIKGETIGLPAPVITPYLIGLSVMLGLLGTFLGMVDTLNGAVTALQGTTELQAIRAGLTAPIQGLGLAFGTSVAGVAASAMLGLMSTLSRRERILATEHLDTQIASNLREFSLAYNKQQTYSALQVQATALPDVADTLNTLASKLVTMSENIEQTLSSQQQAFHQSVTDNYQELAQSIDKSLKETLAESGNLVGESLNPIISTTMAAIQSNASNTHKQLIDTVQNQLSELRSSWQQQQIDHDQTKLQQWSNTFEQLNQQSHAQLSDASELLISELKTLTATQNHSVEQIVTSFASSTDALKEQWQQANLQSLKQQDAMTDSLSKNTEQLSEQLQNSSKQSTAEINRLIASSEQIVKARTESEQQWLTNFEQRAEDHHQALTTLLNTNAQQSIEKFNTLILSAENLVNSRTDTEQQWLSQHQQRAEQLSDAITEQLSTKTQQNIEQITDLVSHYEQLIATRVASEQEWIDKYKNHAEELINNISQKLSTKTEANISKISQLINSSEQLIESRTSSEQQWLSNYEQRAGQLKDILQQSLNQLRTEEQQRGDAAVERLNSLEGKLAEHLSTLGKGLEEPLTNLIATASETPKAAAEVIEQLRNEISKNVARENSLLEERSSIMVELDKLSSSLAQTATDQRESIDSLIHASEQMLQTASAQFNDKVDDEIDKLNEANVQFSGNAIEMASLGEAFTQAVHKFDESNNGLIGNLQRIEASLEQANNRNDEQLAYYVAQARDIIDHSIVSQKSMFDELRHIGESTNAAEVEQA